MEMEKERENKEIAAILEDKLKANEEITAENYGGIGCGCLCWGFPFLLLLKEWKATGTGSDS